MAPPMSEFSAAFQKMRQGGSARDGGVCSDKKVKMRFALSEAVLRRARRHLQEARCVALMRDERKGRLLIRYKACAMSNLSNFAQRFLHAARRACEASESARPGGRP